MRLADKFCLSFLFLLGMILGPTLAVADNVAVIGDSQFFVGTMDGDHDGKKAGAVLIQALENSGAYVTYYAVCGARPGGSSHLSWTEGPVGVCSTSYTTGGSLNASPNQKLPSVAKIVEDSKPDRLVIQLGDNLFEHKIRFDKSLNRKVFDLYVGNKAALETEIKSLVQKIPQNVKCQWIGPTYHAPAEAGRQETEVYRKSPQAVDQMYDVLKEALGDRCRIIDGRRLFSKGNKKTDAQGTSSFDGLHFSRVDSDRWGRFLSHEVQTPAVAAVAPVAPVAPAAP